MIDYSRAFAKMMVVVDCPSDFVLDSLHLEQIHQIDELDWKIVLYLDLVQRLVLSMLL